MRIARPPQSEDERKVTALTGRDLAWIVGLGLALPLLLVLPDASRLEQPTVWLVFVMVWLVGVLLVGVALMWWRYWMHRRARNESPRS